MCSKNFWILYQQVDLYQNEIILFELQCKFIRCGLLIGELNNETSLLFKGNFWFARLEWCSRTVALYYENQQSLRANDEAALISFFY